eukprot:NODE_5616_length_568_cov_2.103314.p1 GENE.NODE_5616_length_568_cov_2.103314~~NODE_5616_length_568_cov_2.103314.p1  ORF type:complete len:140 (-),score=30.03 NODE_5616_length_568_cov_2.103314:21-440(-)
MEPSTAGGDVEVVDVAVAPSVGNDIDKVPVDDNDGEELVDWDKIDKAAGKGTKRRKAEKTDAAQKRACKPKAKPEAKASDAAIAVAKKRGSLLPEDMQKALACAPAPTPQIYTGFHKAMAVEVLLCLKRFAASTTESCP